jgi:N-acetylglucosaminyldiphosphoundecaprenol N-acetyl-beta-D-mannosaminyltransferase
MGRFGVLWLYRFICEPRRLFKRYAVYNSVFLWHLFRQVMVRDGSGK